MKRLLHTIQSEMLMKRLLHNNTILLWNVMKTLLLDTIPSPPFPPLFAKQTLVSADTPLTDPKKDFKEWANKDLDDHKKPVHPSSSLERKGKGNGIDDWETVAIIRCHLLLQPISLREEKCEESEESYWLKQSYYYPAIHLCKSNTLGENKSQLIWLEIYLTFNITA